MKTFSKITVLFLILISLNACKKDEPVAPTTPASTNCKISKVDYGDGYIDYFTYNSLGQVSEYYYDIKDANGKTVRSVPTAYSYDLSGMVTLAKYGDGSGQERLTYTNGALNAIEMFNDKNVSVYKIIVTTDANKRIIGMKDSDNSNTSKTTRDVQGNVLKYEVFDNKNNLIQRDEILRYDNKKNWGSGLIGWPLNLTLPYDYYITYGGYFIEPSGGWESYKFYSIYDINGNNTGKLNLMNDYTRNSQYNSNGYPTKTDIKDAVNLTVNDTRIYSYANCQ